MAIYTRGGDSGQTSLAGGSRVSKASARVEAYGAVDEANSAIGLARCCVTDEFLGQTLRFVQHRLFNCSSSLAFAPGAPAPPSVSVTAEDVAGLENAIDAMASRCPALRGFVLEAGCECASRLHVARAIARRAERRIVALAEHEPVPETVLAFVNRTSDLLHTAALYANVLTGTAEEPWDPATPPPVPAQ